MTINDDDILEGTQSFTLSLSSVDPVIFGTAQANVAILDDDGESNNKININYDLNIVQQN